MQAHLKPTLLACALLQAFAVHAQDTNTPSEAVTEVVVTGNRYIASDRARVGGFSEQSLFDTPASIVAFGHTQIEDLSIRSTTDAMRFDASVSDAYNAVGYAEQFSIRGFKLDNNYSYRKDGFAIPGDAQIPLENKERIEVLKGLSGLTAGVATPGGIVDFVTKRPTNATLRSATFETGERGSLYGAVDMGGRFEDRRFGYRINAAAETIHPYVRGANGERTFISGAFDWQITPDAKLAIDMDYQRRAQITAPGFQLLRNEALPTGVSSKMLLNDQPWTKPVETKTANLGLRFDYRLAPDWQASVAANKHWFKRDDYTAFPYGCTNEGAGFYPGYCSNGDYDVYDYQSVGETKTPWGVQAQVNGKFATGAVRHQLAVGASYAERHDSFGEYVYDYVGYSNIWTPLVTPQAPGSRRTGPVFERRNDSESALFAQDIMTLSDAFTVHAGLRWAKLKRSQYVDEATGYVHKDDHFILPSAAVVYRPTNNWNVYASFSHGLQHGGVAPMQTTNEYQVMDPERSRQVEFGTKAVVRDVELSAALFQIRQGLEYTNAANTFVHSGRETHRGLELTAQGRVAPALNYSLSLAALNTRQEGTGNPAIDGKRVTDVPNFKSTAWLEYTMAAVPGLKVDGVWQYAGRKAFDAENRVTVPSYNIFGVGASYGLHAAGKPVTVRARVENLFDKFYWRDVTPDLGGYLLAGAPRTFRVSATVGF